MKAELVLMGKQIDMAPRAHRRTLVVVIYATLAVFMVCLWLLDRWRSSGTYVILATMLVNRWFLGGYYFGGLIKPFSGKGPRRETVLPPPPFLTLALRVYWPHPEEGEYRNDERELHQRDRVHYQAYQFILYIFLGFCLLANLGGHFLMRRPLLAYELFYGPVLVAIVIAYTLPQAILLWTEPDMEESPLA
jgi:hypothetical protein